MADNLFQNTICINNKDRVSGDLDNFVVNIIPTRNIEKIVLDKIVIPYTWYHVTDLTNEFEIVDTGTHIVNITNGVYTSSTMITELTNQMNNSLSTLTFAVTFNDITNKISISGSSPFRLNFILNQSIAKTIGFEKLFYLPASIHVAPNILDLSHNARYVDIYSKALSRYQKPMIISSGYAPLVRVTNSFHSFGNIIEDEVIKNTVYEFDKGATLKSIDIQLYDSSNNPIEFNGIDSFMLFIKIYSRV